MYVYRVNCESVVAYSRAFVFSIMFYDTLEAQPFVIGLYQ